jgi:hypothetical protein
MTIGMSNASAALTSVMALRIAWSGLMFLISCVVPTW